MKISPFTPLCFEQYVSDGLPSRYVQLWSQTDHILVQVLADTDEGEPDAEIRKDRKSTRLNSSHIATSRMPSSA